MTFAGATRSDDTPSVIEAAAGREEDTMLNWNEYNMKQEQYKDMQRAAMQRQLLREAQSNRRQQRLALRARLLRRLGRSMANMGARLEARYSN